MYKTILFSIALLMSGLCHAQFLNSSKVPRIIPPSADATALGKFADIPISQYTGIPEITIPLTSIKSRDISIPLNLRYHASGIRTEEEASWIGLGWSLDNFATISRTIRGNDDFINESNAKGYIYSTEVPEDDGELTYNFVTSHCFGVQDGQPDIFYYNILGHSGKFFLSRKDDSSDPVKAILLSNKEKIKIDYNEAEGKWTVITKDGYTVVLGTKEYTQAFQFPMPSHQLPYPDYHFGQVDPLDPKNDRAITTWYVDKVSSPLKEEVRFNYKTRPADDKEAFVSRSVLSVNETRTDIRGIGSRWSLDGDYSGFVNSLVKITSFGVADIILDESPPQPSCGNGRTYSGSFTITYNVYPTSIVFSNGTINFVTSERQDISEYHDYTGTNGLKRVYSKPHKLDKIEVLGPQSRRAFLFDQVYYNSNSFYPYLEKRLKLNSVTETNGNARKEPYTFSYEGDGPNGTNFSLPPKNTFARDHWGFFNSKVSNKSAGIGGAPTLIPSAEFETVDVAIVRNEEGEDEITQIPNGEIQKLQGADRSANEAASILGTLNKIVYPTGGYTEFKYESNTFNLEEGTREPKSFFYTADQGEFEVPAPALVTISSDLSCHNCFGNQDNSACFERDIKDFSKVYFEIIRVSDGGKVFTALYGDYYEKLDPTGHNFDNVEETACGIKRTQEITLLPGKYIINTYPIEKFKPHGYVSFTANIPVASNDLVRRGGGIRVKEIRDHDGIDNDNDVVRTFDYSWIDAQQRTLSTGRLMSPPVYTYFGAVSTFSTSGAASVCATFISDSYSNIPLGSSAQGNFVGYDKVTVTYGGNGEYGRSVHYYMNEPDILPDFMNEPFFPNSPTITHAPSNGLLLKEEYFTKDGIKVREVLNGYSKELEDQKISGFITRSFNGCSGSNSMIQFRRYTEPSEWWHLETSYEKNYDTNDPLGISGLSTFTTYTFSDFHKQVRQIETVNSAGQIVIEQLFYPYDIGTAELSAMYDESDPNYKHIHSAVIMREVKRNNVLTEGSINNYEYHQDKDLILLVSQENKLNGGPYELEFSVNQYDAFGNIMQVTDRGGMKTSYIWGYDSKLVIAEVSNASWDEVFHTSFEETDDQGNQESKTGLKSYAGDYVFVPPAEFNPASESVMTFWYLEDGKWKFKKEMYTGGIVTLSDGDRIDEFRIYPSSAKMTTYTYAPQVGITSTSDSNDQTTHYVYDKLGRLKLLRDFEGNIVKRYDYQYRN